MKKRLPAMYFLTGLLGVLLLVAAEDSLAVTVSVTETIDPTITKNVQLVSGSFEVIDGNPPSLLMEQNLSNDPSSVDKRSVLKFSLNAVPSCGVITTAKLKLFHEEGKEIAVPIFGFDGSGDPNNVIVEDAAVTQYLLGVLSDPNDFRNIEVNLDTVVLNNLISSATHLGLMLMGDAGGTAASFKNTPSSGDEKPPELILSFDVTTNSGDFDLNCVVDGHDFLKWQRGESPEPLSDSDLLDWENNYGTTATLAAITSVPEPTSLCFVLLGALGLLANRQTCGYFSSRLRPNAESAALR